MWRLGGASLPATEAPTPNAKRGASTIPARTASTNATAMWQAERALTDTDRMCNTCPAKPAMAMA